MSKKKKPMPLPCLDSGHTVVDTHCHLDMEAYRDDLDKVISRAAQAGVTKILTVGIDLTSSSAAVTLAARHAGVFASVGVHPHHVGELTEEQYGQLKVLARQPKVVAYGEIGMDRVKDYAPVDLQQQHFDRQVRLAKELGLPLIVHDREAHDEILAILRRHLPFPAGGVMHCFSGDSRYAESVMELGFYISIPGVVTFNKADTLLDVARTVPLSRLLLETDGPFLAPVPRRGKRNEPVFVLYTAQKVAELKGVSLAEVAAHTTENADRLFRLGKNGP